MRFGVEWKWNIACWIGFYLDALGKEKGRGEEKRLIHERSAGGQHSTPAITSTSTQLHSFPSPPLHCTGSEAIWDPITKSNPIHFPSNGDQRKLNCPIDPLPKKLSYIPTFFPGENNGPWKMVGTKVACMILYYDVLLLLFSRCSDKYGMKME